MNLENQTILIEEYNKIWDKYSIHFPELLKRGFLFQSDQDEDECDLLFIGINPSYDENSEDVRGFYIRPDESMNEIHPYFKSFKSIEKELKKSYSWNGQWTHIDIFAFRETNQKYIENTLLKSEIGVQFLYEQLMIARKRILKIKPKVIVVSNALVRMFSGKERQLLQNNTEVGVWMDFKFHFNKEIGTDEIIEPNELAGVKVFFTSMLSGQRALDNGSKERLIWHIAQNL